MVQERYITVSTHKKNVDEAKTFFDRVTNDITSRLNKLDSRSEELDAKFVSQAAQAGFVNLKGHRKTGGMRASIYNAMPVEGVEKLCDFIKAFDKAN